MTTETISLGSCPTCSGPVQFIAPETGHASGCEYPNGLCRCSTSLVRRVHLPNIDEDLGNGWRLSGLDWSALAAEKGEAPWTARGWHPHRGFVQVAADTPSDAYLGLRTGIGTRS